MRSLPWLALAALLVLVGCARRVTSPIDHSQGVIRTITEAAPSIPTAHPDSLTLSHGRLSHGQT